MFNKILLVNIHNKDGLISFCEDERVLDLIKVPANIEIASFNDFNNINEICEYITDIDYDSILLKFNTSSGLFAENLTNMLIEEKYKVIWLIEDIKQTSLNISENNVKVFNSYEYLNLYLLGQEVKTDNIKQEELEESFFKNNGYSDKYNAIMTNGYIAYITGIYDNRYGYAGLKHVHIQANSDFKELVEKLDINLNSALIVDVDKYKSNLYKKIKKVNGLISHVHQTSNDMVCFDDSSYNVKKQECSFKSYINLCKEGKIDLEKIYIVNINNEEDIKYFENELENFRKSGKIMSPNFYLSDECRWTGACGINRFNRINIVNECIRQCNTSDKGVYNIEDNKFTKLAKINREKEKIQTERNCVECSCNKNCTKCICLPNDIEGISFCHIMKSYPYLQEYLAKKNFLLFLIINSKLFKYDKIKVSSQAYPIIYNKKSSKYDISLSVHLFGYDDKYYIYNLKSNNIVKIDEKLAFILEGYSLAEDESEIIDNFKEKHKIDEDCAISTVRSGISILKDSGIII